MSQLLQKPYDCMNCGQQIRLAKIDNPSAPGQKKRWLKYELNGITEHICKKNLSLRSDDLKGQASPTTLPNNNADLLTEVSEIKARLLVILDRLTTMEQGLGK